MRRLRHKPGVPGLLRRESNNRQVARDFGHFSLPSIDRPPSAHFPKFVLRRGVHFHELRKVGTSVPSNPKYANEVAANDANFGFGTPAGRFTKMDRVLPPAQQ